MLSEYLKKVFGEDVVNEYALDISNLPIYLRNGYCFRAISVFNKRYVFVHPENGLNLKSYKVQKKKLEEVLSLPVVLYADTLIFQQRDNLIKSGLEFIEPGKQIFLPSIGTILDNRRKKTVPKAIEKFTPQIQLCALFFLYGQKKEYTSGEISEAAGLNPMAVSRGISALAELKLLSVRKIAGKNYYALKTNKAGYLEVIKDCLITPVSKRLYAKEKDIENIGIKAGYTALEQLTDIADAPDKTYAISKNAYKTIEKSCRQYPDNFLSSDKMVKVEVWKYDPGIFMTKRCVDKLSLYLSFENNNDERTEEALNKLINEIKNN